MSRLLGVAGTDESNAGTLPTMQRYDIDRARSRFVIEAASSLHPIVATASPAGRLETVGGDPADPSTWTAASVTVAIGDLRTGNPLVDRETRRRAGTDETITATFERVVDVHDGRATLEGTIRFHGRDVLVEGDVTATETPAGVRIVGSGTFDVRWWGMEPPKLLMLRVEPEVTVTLEAAFVPGVQIST